MRGRFDQVSGTITVSPDPAACSVDVTIDVATISTQVSQRDDDLRSEAYFDVKKFLTMTYQGRGIHRVSADLWRMDGSLTMHGITKVVPLTFKYNGVFADTNPNHPARVAFHGTAATKRAEFGMGARDNAAEVADSTAPDVDIEIDVEADATLLPPNGSPPTTSLVGESLMQLIERRSVPTSFERNPMRDEFPCRPPAMLSSSSVNRIEPAGARSFHYLATGGGGLRQAV